MSILLHLSTLALRHVAEGACAAVGLPGGGEALARSLLERLTDHSQRLTKALHEANAQAWKALEIALAGETFWERCKALLGRADTRALAQQVRTFLDAIPQAQLPTPGVAFRRQCLTELRAAREAGLLDRGGLEPGPLAGGAAGLVRLADPQQALDGEWQVLGQLAEVLQQVGHKQLAYLVALRPADGVSLLALSVRYFFRRQVEDDPRLFQGLAFARLETLGAAQEQGFAALAEALRLQGQHLEELLRDVQGVVVQTHGVVLDLQEQLKGQSAQLQQLGRNVLELLQQHQLHKRPLRASDSLSLRTPQERELVRQLVAHYRALPEEEQRRLPALLNAVGKLEVVAGDFEAAQRDFQQVAALSGDVALRAEAHYHAYQAALQRRDWSGALAALGEAVRLDGARLAPFPGGKYQPLRILGAGGFGVAFLCRHRYMSADMVVKALTGESLERGPEQVFAEATALRRLEHPAIIRIQDCGYADAAARARPYLVMDYFEGQTLEEAVRAAPLEVPVCLEVARQMAEGLRAAHERGILHRDVKPANVLVRQGPSGWQVKLIDFGLALQRTALQATQANSRTLLGHSIAGTLEYAAPEQLGRLEGARIGPAADVYGFAKTCCQALFQTPEPTPRHWQKLPPGLTDLLGDCLERRPEDRPADFGAVLQRLAALGQPPHRGGPSPQEGERRREEEVRAAEERCRLEEAEEKRQLEDRLREEDERRYRQAMAQAEEEQRQLQERQRQADNLRRWEESGEPRAWVEARGGAWEQAAWLGLLDRLRGSAYWPMEQEAVSQVLERARKEYREGLVKARTASPPTPSERPPNPPPVAPVCSSCGKAVPVPANSAGKKVLCLNCAVPRGTCFGQVACLLLIMLIVSVGGWLYNLFFGPPTPVQPAMSLSPKASSVVGLVFRPDGQRLVALGEYGWPPMSWDLPTGNLTFSPSTLGAPSKDFSSPAHDKDGRRVVCTMPPPGGWRHERVVVWDVDTSRQVAFWEMDKDVYPLGRLTLSPDGKLVAGVNSTQFGRPRQIFVWEPDSKKEPRWFMGFGEGNRGEIASLAFSPDGRLLAAGASEKVKVWDLTAGKELFELESHPKTTTANLAFSPNGKWLLSRVSGSLKIWDVAKGQLAHSLASSNRLAFGPDGDLLAYALDRQVRVWDLNGRREVAAFPKDGTADPNYYPSKFAFHPAGKLLAVGGPRSTVTIWEIAGGKEVGSLSLYGKSSANSLVFSPDGKLLAVGAFSQIQVWDSAAWQHVVTFASAEPMKQMDAISFRPDGQRVAAVQDGVVRLWDIPPPKKK